VFDGGFFCFLGSGCYRYSLSISDFRVDPCGFVWVFSFCGLALVVSVYTPGVLMGALRFLIKSSYLSKKRWVTLIC
jgi:hypothetical protein